MTLTDADDQAAKLGATHYHDDVIEYRLPLSGKRETTPFARYYFNAGKEIGFILYALLNHPQGAIERHDEPREWAETPKLKKLGS